MTIPTAPEILAWLLTYALHSTVLLGTAWLAVRSGRLSPAFNDVIWKTALVGGVLTATAQSTLDRRPVGTFAIGTPTAVTATPAASNEFADPEASETSTAEGAAVGVPVGATTLDGGASAPARDWTALIALTWLLAASSLVLWYVARRLVLVGRLGDRRSVEKGPVTSMLDALCRETGVRTYVHLTVSGAISSPVALGSGEICLPAAALVELDPAQQRAMLAHELAHLVRRDPQWLALSCLVERAFFFQPMNRLGRNGVQESAELCADEWAARHSGGVPLARALVKVAEWIQASPLGVPVAGFAEERSQLTKRVSRLLEAGAIAAPRSRATAVAVAAGALVLTAAFAPGVQQASSMTSSMRQSSAASADLGRLEPLAAGAAVAVDTAIVRAVMARLKDEVPEVRRAAADALGRLHHPMAISALIEALGDEEHDVRRAALSALSNYERGVPAAPIRKLLASEDEEMRYSAIEILKGIRDRQSIPTLAQLVTDPSEEVRHAALHAMEELEAPMGEDLLTRALDDVSADVRQTAASIAGDRQVVGVIPKLIKMLDDRNSSVRDQAAEALTEMRTDASHAALKKALTHSDPNVRRIAVEYFGEEIDK